MDSIEIYYFSGTGNSLHIAKELQRRIPKINLIPIVSCLNNEIKETGSSIVGFVFPTYLTTVPMPVSKFLEKINLDSSKYIFSITTRIGTMSLANIHVKRILKKKGKLLDASFIINMANNSPTGLKPIGDKDWVNKIKKDRIEKIEYEAINKLELIKACISNKEKNEKKRDGFFSKVLEVAIYSMTKNSHKEIAFYTDSTCISCGICEKVCLSNKIRIINKKPMWSKHVQCYFCYACFNYCPEQSILVRKLYTEKNGRYSHPEISPKDIEEQKRVKE